MTHRPLRRHAGSALAAALLCLGAQAMAAPRMHIEAQRGHPQCPLAGQDQRSLLIDNAEQWRAWVPATQVQALGRGVRWGRERVLVHALAQQPTLGVRVAAFGLVPPSYRQPPRLGLRITQPAPEAMAATALSRPCVFVALTRGPWHELQLVDAQGTPLATLPVAAAVDAHATDGGVAVPPLTPLPGTELVKPAASAATR